MTQNIWFGIDSQVTEVCTIKGQKNVYCKEKMNGLWSINLNQLSVHQIGAKDANLKIETSEEFYVLRTVICIQKQELFF